jgi:hypothetical protein
MNLNKRPVFTPVSVFILIIVSAAGVAMVFGALFPKAHASFTYALLFYGPAWLATNGLFGGPQNAPGWSYLPSMVLAVAGQNSVIWILVNWGRNKLKS